MKTMRYILDIKLVNANFIEPDYNIKIEYI